MPIYEFGTVGGVKEKCFKTRVSAFDKANRNGNGGFGVPRDKYHFNQNLKEDSSLLFSEKTNEYLRYCKAGDMTIIYSRNIPIKRKI